MRIAFAVTTIFLFFTLLTVYAGDNMKAFPPPNEYLIKHPYLEEFAHSPSCEFIEIRVKRYILVERFQNVTEYRIDHDMDHTT